LEDGSLEAFVERLDRVELEQPLASFDAQDGLTIEEGRLVALVFNPQLRIARLRTGQAAASAEHASLWADPQLSVSVLRLTDNVPDPWILSPGLSFTIPTSGSLAAEQDQADAMLGASRLAALEAEWAVWHDVREAWIEWSAASLRIAETERLVEALDVLVDTTSRLAEAGELDRTEASLFTVERAQRRNLLLRLRGEVSAAEQRLRAHLGLAPEAPVTLVPSFTLKESSTAAALPNAFTGQEFTDAIAERNPRLARLRAEYEVAEATLKHEIRKQYPDLTLGPQLQAEEGRTSIGFIAGLPLPFLNANRRAIAEARVEREIARATYEVEYESLVGRGAAARALANALAEQRTEIEETLVPILDEQLQDAAELVRLGEGTSLVLLESLTRAHETKLELIETLSTEALARTELEFVTGPLEPATLAPDEQ
jgi:outer membrane protein TolC